MLLYLGRVPTVVVSSAKAAREVLKTHDLDCCSRPHTTGFRRLTRNYLDIGFSPYGDNWRQMRKIFLLEFFSLKRVQSFRFIREEVISLTKSLSQSSSSTTPVNLSNKLYSLTAKGFSAEEYFPFVGWIIDRITGHQAKIDQVFLKLDALFQQVTDDHLKPGRTTEQEDIVDVLLRKERNETESDTAATTVVRAMAELARNTRIMKKAQDEVRNSVEKKGKVTEDDIDQLQYLKLDPEEFFPEPFVNNSIDFKGQNFEYLSFGSGRRSCPGTHMGMIMVELALANLL
ncbi:hypothetical protein GH714_043880 [Hevea brasiliensis]|uniref:Cytochrome P450 n=1 Tax=Hevea brasiliensis TaxID=3981 RepID=A0A6A6K4C2_HEVBR|nr:hypothetical protein GH714_043880 [Hevea brasiliensis]